MPTKKRYNLLHYFSIVLLQRCLCVLIIILSSFQYHPLRASISNYVTNTELAKPTPLMVIPFELHNNFIILSLQVNDSPPLKFIYDTGADNNLFFEIALARVLKLKFHKTIQVMGADLQTAMEAHICPQIKFTSENQDEIIHELLVLSDNIFDVNAYFGFRIDGIIGNGFFRFNVVEIDFDKQVIKVYNPDEITTLRPKFTWISSIWIKGKPYITPAVKFNDETEATTLKLLFDTGASVGMMLYTDNIKKEFIPSKVLPGVLGMGISGPINGFIGKTQTVDMGFHQFHSFITHFHALDSLSRLKDESGKHGILGNGLINHFNVLIDFPHQQLYLSKNKNTHKPLRYDRSGMLVIAGGNNFDQFEIQNVIENSPAHQAGIISGDIIVSMNGIPTKYLTLQRILNRLSSPRTKKIRLQIVRNGKSILCEVYPRDLL